ncbi:MAG TPA: FHA domain-containing protein, partial [Polyangiaceae bacterium]|nr:FHA domain-containing protein [Polyangiaceae bacterium]
PATLRHGSMVRLERVWLEIKMESAMPTAQSVQVTKDLALAMVAEAMRREGECMTARLVVIAGPDTGREVPLDEAGQSVVIGRGRDVHFPIDVDDASRRHARVLRRGDLALLRDLGSRNGTLVEGTAIAADRDTVLRPGDQFVICSDVFVYENPAVEALRQIEALDDELLDSDEWNAVPPPPSTVDIVAEPMPPSVDPPPPSEPKPVIRQAFPRNERRTSTQKKSGWGRTDLIVVFLALVVMVLSTVGMLWLFRT